MTKFLKTSKGKYYLDNERVTKAHFLSKMIEENRKTYIKESKKGKYYYYKILKSEMSFLITSKIVSKKVDKKGKKEIFYTWEFSTINKRQKTTTDFYAIETECYFEIFKDNQFLEENIKEFNELLKRMLDIIKKKHKLKDVYCRAIVSVIYFLDSKEEPFEFERKYSSKGYTYEESINEIFVDLINKMLFGQSIVSIIFTRVNLLCT